MNNFKTIRERLGLTQAALASGINCSQGNISAYERGQTVPPDAAQRLIDFAATLGHPLSFNEVYAGQAGQRLRYTGPERRDPLRPRRSGLDRRAAKEA
jgi:putative transcriptional regulator